MRHLLDEASWNPYAMEYLMGSLLLAEGDEEGALAHLQKAEAADPGQPDLYLAVAEVYTTMKEWADVERCCRKALALDPDNALALGVGRSLLARRRFLEAAEEALTAVGLLYFNPPGHFLLGTALQHLGRTAEAVEALRVAVSQNPNFVAAHRRLAQIYERQLGDAAKAAEHRLLAWQAGRVKAFQAGKKETGPARGRAAEEMPHTTEAIGQQQTSPAQPACWPTAPWIAARQLRSSPVCRDRELR